MSLRRFGKLGGVTGLRQNHELEWCWEFGKHGIKGGSISFGAWFSSMDKHHG